MAKIVSVSPRLFRLPLAEVLSDAKHGDHTHFELIVATVTLQRELPLAFFRRIAGFIISP